MKVLKGRKEGRGGLREGGRGAWEEREGESEMSSSVNHVDHQALKRKEK